MSAEIDPPTRRVVPDSSRSVTVPSHVPTQEERALAEANRRIDNYTSKLATSNPSCWAEIAPVVRRYARLLDPKSATAAANLCSVLAGFLAFCWRVGISLEPEAAFRPENVSRYVRTVGSPGTISSKLEDAGRRLTVTAAWVPAPRRFARRPPKPGYSPEQIVRYFQLVNSQPTAKASQLLLACLLLGLGCGLDGRTVSDVRGTDVRRQGGAVLVEVSDRVVACRFAYEDRLWSLAKSVGSGLLVGRPSSVNSKLHRFVDQETGECLNLTRLRATWLLDILGPLKAIRVALDAAGIRTTHSLDPYISMLPQMEAEEEIAFLRGTRP